MLECVLTYKENKLSTRHLEKEIDEKIFDLYELSETERSIILAASISGILSEDSINIIS